MPTDCHRVASQPNLVARWRLFFKGPVAGPPIFSLANQALLIDSIFHVLNIPASRSIHFGVRPGAAQDVESGPLPHDGLRFLVNIVVDPGSEIPVAGPPARDPQ